MSKSEHIKTEEEEEKRFFFLYYTSSFLNLFKEKPN